MKPMPRIGSVSIFELMLDNIGLETLMEAAFGGEETIIKYDEKTLYENLVEKEIPISKINQVMKLHSLKYPLLLKDIARLSTDALRNIVKDVKYARKFG